MPGFSRALVGIPLAAATMALGAVDTGSMKASEVVRVAGSIRYSGFSSSCCDSCSSTGSSMLAVAALLAIWVMRETRRQMSRRSSWGESPLRRPSCSPAQAVRQDRSAPSAKANPPPNRMMTPQASLS